MSKLNFLFKNQVENQLDDGLLENRMNSLPKSWVPNFFVDPNWIDKYEKMLNKKFKMIELSSKIESLDLYESK